MAFLVLKPTGGHQVDSLQQLESPNLSHHGGSLEHQRLLGVVGLDAAHEVGLGVHQGSQEVVQAGVEVLR